MFWIYKLQPRIPRIPRNLALHKSLVSTSLSLTANHETDMSMEDPQMFAGKAMYQILQIISFNFRETSESFNSAQRLSSFQLVTRCHKGQQVPGAAPPPYDEIPRCSDSSCTDHSEPPQAAVEELASGVETCQAGKDLAISWYHLISNDILSKILPIRIQHAIFIRIPPSLKDIICIFFAVQGNHSHTHGLPIVLHQKCDSKAKDQPEKGILASPQTKSISSLSTGRNWVWIKSKIWGGCMEKNWKWFDTNFWATNLPILPMSKLKCWAFWESYPNPNRVNHHFAWYPAAAQRAALLVVDSHRLPRFNNLIHHFVLGHPGQNVLGHGQDSAVTNWGGDLVWTVKDYDILWYICMFRLGHVGTTIIILLKSLYQRGWSYFDPYPSG